MSKVQILDRDSHITFNARIDLTDHPLGKQLVQQKTNPVDINVRICKLFVDSLQVTNLTITWRDLVTVDLSISFVFDKKHTVPKNQMDLITGLMIGEKTFGLFPDENIDSHWDFKIVDK